MRRYRGDYEEEGDGGSISDGSECDDFDSAFVDAFRKNLMLTDETAAVEEDETLLDKGGLPDNINLPAPPTDWNPPSIKVEKGEPHPEQRLLGYLTAFQEHWDASYKFRLHPNKCYVCGEDSYHKF